MSKKTPEEIAALKAKYGDKSAEKAAAKAAKKAKYGDANADQNMPVVEMRIPWVLESGKELDLERSPWDSYCDALEANWRWRENGEHYTGPCKRKVVRT